MFCVRPNLLPRIIDFHVICRQLFSSVTLKIIIQLTKEDMHLSKSRETDALEINNVLTKKYIVSLTPLFQESVFKGIIAVRILGLGIFLLVYQGHTITLEPQILSCLNCHSPTDTNTARKTSNRSKLSMFSVFNKGIFMLSFFVCYQKWKKKNPPTIDNYIFSSQNVNLHEIFKYVENPKINIISLETR